MSPLRATHHDSINFRLVFRSVLYSTTALVNSARQLTSFNTQSPWRRGGGVSERQGPPSAKSKPVGNQQYKM